MITAAELIAAARSMVGAPWLHQGRSASGLDCIGFVIASAQKAGLDLVELVGANDARDYGRFPGPELLRLANECCFPIDAPQPGALVLFQFPGEKHPRHEGIWTERSTVIHALATRRCVVEHGCRAKWARWLHSSWRLPGVDYALS